MFREHQDSFRRHTVVQNLQKKHLGNTRKQKRESGEEIMWEEDTNALYREKNLGTRSVANTFKFHGKERAAARPCFSKYSAQKLPLQE